MSEQPVGNLLVGKESKFVVKVAINFDKKRVVGGVNGCGMDGKGCTLGLLALDGRGTEVFDLAN